MRITFWFKGNRIEMDFGYKSPFWSQMYWLYITKYEPITDELSRDETGWDEYPVQLFCLFKHPKYWKIFNKRAI